MSFHHGRDLSHLAHSVCYAKTPLGALDPGAVAGTVFDLLRGLHEAGGEGEPGSPQLVVVRRLVNLPRERQESVALHNSPQLVAGTRLVQLLRELRRADIVAWQRWTARRVEPFHVMLGTRKPMYKLSCRRPRAVRHVLGSFFSLSLSLSLSPSLSRNTPSLFYSFTLRLFYSFTSFYIFFPFLYPVFLNLFEPFFYTLLNFCPFSVTFFYLSTLFKNFVCTLKKLNFVF